MGLGKSAKAVENVDFKIPKGKTFGLVGESGCGKSTVARLVVRLYEPSAGSVNLEGVDLGGLNSREAMEPMRRKMQMIFQDPTPALIPAGELQKSLLNPFEHIAY